MRNIRPTCKSDRTFRDRLCRLNTNSNADLCILIWNTYFQCWSKSFYKYFMWIDSVLLFGKLWQPLSTVNIVVLSLQLLNLFRNCPLSWLVFFFLFFFNSNQACGSLPFYCLQLRLWLVYIILYCCKVRYKKTWVPCLNAFVFSSFFFIHIPV